MIWGNFLIIGFIIISIFRTLKVKYNKFKVDHAKVDARLKNTQSTTAEYEREIRDYGERYSLLNELKDKVELESQYLQQQNKHLIEENEKLNKSAINK